MIYSLRYIRWSVYWKTIVAAAFKANYSDIEIFLFELRRFYYLNWIAGNTLSQIKQTSFNVLKKVVDNKPISEIKADLRGKIEVDNVE